jgi:hypothetical protein
MTPHPKQQNIRLPARTAVFLGVVCCAILAWSGWREWQSRKADLALAEIETRNLSRSVTQYADDTLELSNSLLNALVSRLESDGTGPDAIAKLRKVLESRKPALGRVRGLGLDARIQYVSPSCARILGCEPAALINTDSLAGVRQRLLRHALAVHRVLCPQLRIPGPLS